MKIVARVIIQMAGGPKKHIQDTLRKYVDKIEEDYADIKILKRHLSPPKKQGSMFSLFAELELEIDGPENILYFCLDYMPSSIEIVEPDEIRYESGHFTDFLNDMQQKLHKIDMTLKSLSAENQLLRRNALTLSYNILQVQLRAGPRDAETLSKGAGIPIEHTRQFLEALVEEGKLKKEEDRYRLA
jgi:hypothetical protein